MKRLSLLLGLLLLFFFISCKEDDYIYPSVRTEFIDARTDANGVLACLISDAGQQWKVRYRKGLSGLTPDSLYRTVSVYEHLPSSEEVQLYSATLIMAEKPVKADEIGGEILTDPVDIQSIWVSGNYLNMVLRVKVKDTPHRFHFIDEGFSRESEGCVLNLRLYHDRCGDFEAFEKEVYLSVPLYVYNTEKEWNGSLRFYLNTYKEGQTSRRFKTSPAQ